MAFSKAVIQIKPASVGTGIKCQLRQTRKAAATLTLFLNAAVAIAAGIDDRDKIEVLIGDGEHHGLLRLRKNNSVGEAIAIKRETGKGAFIILKLGHQPAFVDRTEPSSWVQWEKVEDGWIEIVLPKWADETAPTKKAAPAAAAPVRAPSAPPPVAKRQVTASVMNDPPPGRREMLARMGDMKG